MTPRGIALGLGLALALLTALELVFGQLAVGDAQMLQRTTKANLLHWVVALTMLGAFFARSTGALRTILRVVGLILLAFSLWGILSPDGFGRAFGFGGGIPNAYSVYHAAAALIALWGGFLAVEKRA